MIYADEIRNKLDRAVRTIVREKVQYCKHPHADFTRNRKLTLQDTVKLLLTMSGGSLNKELYQAGVPVSPSAFCQSRAKISPKIFRDILAKFNRLCKDRKTIRGYHLYAVDGSCINMARNPKLPSYVESGNYNQMHLNALFDIENKTYADAVIQPQPRADEIGAMIEMLKRGNFQGKNLVICDRGYESYNLFAHFLHTPNIDFLCRVKQENSAMREVSKLPMMELDKEISLVITNTQTKQDKANGYIFVQKESPKRKKSTKKRYSRWDFPSPYSMKFRIVRILLDNGEYETLVTSLPKSFTMEDIKALYHKRWGIETSFRELKYVIGLINLHGKSDDYVRQEIYAALTMYNFCSRIAGAVVVKQKAENIYMYRVNFKMAVFLCQEYYKTPEKDGKTLMEEIGRYLEPVRPGRADERNIRAKGFVGFTYRVAA